MGSLWRPVGGLCGAATAVFLWLLDAATTFRTDHPVIVYTLPLAGLALGWLYQDTDGIPGPIVPAILPAIAPR